MSVGTRSVTAAPTRAAVREMRASLPDLGGPGGPGQVTRQGAGSPKTHTKIHPTNNNPDHQEQTHHYTPTTPMPSPGFAARDPAGTMPSRSSVTRPPRTYLTPPSGQKT